MLWDENNPFENFVEGGMKLEVAEIEGIWIRMIEIGIGWDRKIDWEIKISERGVRSDGQLIWQARDLREKHKERWVDDLRERER